MSSLELYNSTLREGTQHTNVNFDLPEMREIAVALLDGGNAHFVEIHCYPGRSTEHARSMLERFEDRVVTHHRSYEPDIKNRASIGPGNTSMFQTTSPNGLESLGLTIPELKEKVRSDIILANSLKLSVAKYTFEHATDTDPELLKELAIIAQNAGTKRISLPDTKGKSEPHEYAELLEYLMDYVDVPLVAHCHDDLGLAVANSLAAYDVGVRCIDSSVLGLGERAGQTRTEVINAILRVKRGETIPTENLNMIVELVSALTGVYPGPHDPVTGRYSFTHRAGTHAHKINRLGGNNEHPYLPFDPLLVGRNEDFNLSNLSGASTVEAMLRRYDIEAVEREKLNEIASRVKNLAEENGSDVISRDFEYIASDVLGRSLDWFIRKRGEPETSTYRIFVDTNRPPQEVAREIRRTVRSARYIEELFGEYDILVVIPNTTSEFGNAYVDTIRRIPGVKGTATYISARSWK